MASYTHGQGTLRPPIQAFPIASSLSHRHGLGSTPSHYISMNGPVQVTASNAPTEMSENSTELPDNSGSEILAHPGLYPSGHQIIQWTFRTTTETASYYYNVSTNKLFDSNPSLFFFYILKLSYFIQAIE